jgi:hypothetical protein
MADNRLERDKCYIRATQAQPRADAESVLRDIAFVLKMTQRVREEMELEQEVHELVPV